MNREVEKKKYKLNKITDETRIVEQKVEELRKQFKDAEFQHKMEMGEIREALHNFKSKE